MRQAILSRINYLEMYLRAGNENRLRHSEIKDQPREGTGQKLDGLKGGGGNKSFSSTKNTSYLQLTNTRNDCFVNSIIQLVRATGYGDFLMEKLPLLLVGAHPQSYKLSRLLSDLYCGQANGQVSTTAIRRCVAQKSGKGFWTLEHNKMQKNFFVLLRKLYQKS